MPHLSSRWNWKKTAGSRWTRFGVRVPRTLEYLIIALNLIRVKVKHVIAMHAHLRQTDGQTDEHHGNSVTIRSSECIAR